MSRSNVQKLSKAELVEKHLVAVHGTSSHFLCYPVGSLQLPLEIEEIYLHNNKLEGVLPEEWGAIKGLKVIDLSGNNLRGVLPTQWSSFSLLTSIDLHGNRLEGVLRKNWSALIALKSMDLSDNQLEGELPQSWSELIALETLDLSNNNLSGELPWEWSTLRALDSINLSNNKLEGTLPKQWSVLTTLRSLYVNSNQLMGEVPEEWCNLTSFTLLDLRGNTNLTLTVPNIGKFLWTSPNSVLHWVTDSVLEAEICEVSSEDYAEEAERHLFAVTQETAYERVVTWLEYHLDSDAAQLEDVLMVDVKRTIWEGMEDISDLLTKRGFVLLSSTAEGLSFLKVNAAKGHGTRVHTTDNSGDKRSTSTLSCGDGVSTISYQRAAEDTFLGASEAGRDSRPNVSDAETSTTPNVACGDDCAHPTVTPWTYLRPGEAFRSEKEGSFGLKLEKTLHNNHTIFKGATGIMKAAVSGEFCWDQATQRLCMKLTQLGAAPSETSRIFVENVQLNIENDEHKWGYFTSKGVSLCDQNVVLRQGDVREDLEEMKPESKSKEYTLGGTLGATAAGPTASVSAGIKATYQDKTKTVAARGEAAVYLQLTHQRKWDFQNITVARDLVRECEAKECSLLDEYVAYVAEGETGDKEVMTSRNSSQGHVKIAAGVKVKYIDCKDDLNHYSSKTTCIIKGKVRFDCKFDTFWLKVVCEE